MEVKEVASNPLLGKLIGYLIKSTEKLLQDPSE